MKLLLALLGTLALPGTAPVTVRILHFSDYHSHALPFRSEGRPGQGGLARALALFKEARAGGPTLVLSGGDMLNKGVPVWSDEFGCVEWPWMDGLVDAMALGNHDLDYGSAAFEACRTSTRVPVLSANLVDAQGAPALTVQGRPYLVRDVGGVRIGVFALAGPDVQRLIRPAHLPPGTRWADAVQTARAMVATLREKEKVQAVVFIGHQSREDDAAMARAVPGIDLVLGTHSHHKGGLETIRGTATWTISPYQYLAYVSDVRLRFTGGRLVSVEGALLPLDERRPDEPRVAERIAALQGQLVKRRPERFAVIGRAAHELSDAGLASGESLIGNWVTDVVRERAGVHAFFSTASSFRAGLPPGEVTLEDLYTAIPYPNRVAVVRLTGAQVLQWLAVSLARRGSDTFSQLSGIRYAVRDGRPADVHVLREAGPGGTYVPLDPAGTYSIGTTDYQAGVVDAYREIYAAGREPRLTDLDVHVVLRDALAAGPARAVLDGRSGGRQGSP
jgi:5'-nucleotidase / UDP-sugar diphosphatase